MANDASRARILLGRMFRRIGLPLWTGVTALRFNAVGDLIEAIGCEP